MKQIIISMDENGKTKMNTVGEWTDKEFINTMERLVQAHIGAMIVRKVLCSPEEEEGKA